MIRVIHAALLAACLGFSPVLAEDASVPPAESVVGDTGSAPIAEADALFAGDDEAGWLRAAGLYRAAAEAGDAHAMVRLASLYETGRGLPEDLEEAARLYRRAVEAGSDVGLYRLGMMLLEGRGVTRNRETARSYLTRAAEMGNLDGIVALVAFYREEDDTQSVREWLQRAADAGRIPAILELAELELSSGDIEAAVKGFEAAAAAGEDDALLRLAEVFTDQEERADPARAIRYLRQAIDRNSIAARLRLATMYRAGNGVAIDLETAEGLIQAAIEELGEADDAAIMHELGIYFFDAGDAVEAERWLDAAARAGNSEAAWTLADAYYLGDSPFEESMEQARVYYRIGADLGDVLAMSQIARMYQWARGGPQNNSEAARYYRLAYEASGDAGYLGDYLDVTASINAETSLRWVLSEAEAKQRGDIYSEVALKSWNTRDQASAVKYWKLAAELSDVSGMFMLGRAYAEGWGGLTVDHSRSLDWLLRAAESNDPRAQYEVCARYHERSEPADAFHWCELAAKQGYGPALNTLGLWHYTGWGVDTDHERAEAYFREAAAARSVPAQFNLCNFFSNGVAGAPDLEEAARWCKMAADNNHADARWYLARAHFNGSGVPEDHVVSANYAIDAAGGGSEGARAFLSSLDNNSVPIEFRRQLQERLKEAGHYDGAIDGSIGPGTRRAIEAALGAPS